MKSEQDILAALRALAESDREKEAPPEVETRLRQAFRRKQARKQARKTWKRSAVWGLAAAAGVAAVIASYPSRPRPEPVRTQAAVQQPAAVPQPIATPAPEIARVVSKPVRKAAPVRPAQRREIVTEFFPLVDVAPPFERGELVRVNLPASAMRTVGLPVREDRLADRVQADVLVGQEGMPRAIRFVKYSQ